MLWFCTDNWSYTSLYSNRGLMLWMENSRKTEAVLTKTL